MGVAAGSAATSSSGRSTTEQVILGELLAQAIERETDLRVERRLNLGGTAIATRPCSAAASTYVEYTGTA